MQFLTPVYLFGAALIALPIVLHWLRRDAAPAVPFTAVRLLQQTPIERSRRRRLRDLLLLAARVLALLLLAASFARPYIVGTHSSARPTIVAIDRSFSMTAPGRMERARELARQAVNDAGSDRVGVVAFDQRAEVLSPFGSAASARAAIQNVQAGFEGTRYAVALDKASELAMEDGRARLVVVTDLQRSGFDGDPPTLPDGIELVVRDVGTASENLAVIDMRVDPRRVVVTVHNFGGTTREADVRLEASETPGAVAAANPAERQATRHIKIAPATSAEVGFDGPLPSGAYQAAVDDAEGYAADNVRYAVATRRALPRVLLVTGAAGSGNGFYLSRALQAGGEDGPDFDARLVTGPEFASLESDDIRRQAVIVLLSTRGMDRRVRDPLRTFLTSGGGLFVAASTDVDPSVLSTVLAWSPALSVRDASTAGVLAVTDLRHPIFRPFDAVAANLGQVSFQRVWQVDPAKDWKVVARYTNALPALLERTMGAGKVLLFTSDLDRRWNNFPLHSAFVPFVQESVRYLGAQPPRASAVSVADVPVGIQPKPGVVQADGHLLAVNVDPRESATERASSAEFSRLVARTTTDMKAVGTRAGQQSESKQNYWQYGLLLMLGALIAESIVGSRW
jgi:hypothetical protein